MASTPSVSAGRPRRMATVRPSLRFSRQPKPSGSPLASDIAATRASIADARLRSVRVNGARTRRRMTCRSGVHCRRRMKSDESAPSEAVVTSQESASTRSATAWGITSGCCTSRALRWRTRVAMSPASSSRPRERMTSDPTAEMPWTIVARSTSMGEARNMSTSCWPSPSSAVNRLTTCTRSSESTRSRCAMDAGVPGIVTRARQRVCGPSSSLTSVAAIVSSRRAVSAVHDRTSLQRSDSGASIARPRPTAIRCRAAASSPKSWSSSVAGPLS